nr:TPA_asm: m30 uORF [Murid betaherpesvirus 1]DBA07757.1 TPA_asm: m30 uORF [Murid betaherpesvirus 1]
MEDGAGDKPDITTTHLYFRETL